MRKNNPLHRALELDNLERQSLADGRLGAVFLDKLPVEADCLDCRIKGDNGEFVLKFSYLGLNYGADTVFLLNLVPWVREKLLVTEAELVVVLIEVEDDNVNLVARSNEL